ncbi:DUF2567 domain-containing protein [Kutzneria kofuensis]|uniref:DUF2567 domain-containing protein n=1 Tax=Kutzneria kofuensis TaxID=103725 RepID=A0A7W9KL90_9PSEU|nr:DUF2567 domain-containing protein [Kutzneria kofuensis]MBB5894333.1 hypothetical protein [Kutzneria kofuensis]
MSEHAGERAEPMRIPPVTEKEPEPVSSEVRITPPTPTVAEIMAMLPQARRPRVVVKRDLLPAVSVLSTVALTGLLVGWLWSILAPPQRVILVDGQQLPLLDESYHRFDDLILFVLIGLGMGLVVGGVVWMLRERRGPVIMIAAVLGSALGAWLAMKVGVSWAGSHYALTGTPANRAVFDQAPVLESTWVVLAQPLATALAYGTLTAWNGMDDLGRRLG